MKIKSFDDLLALAFGFTLIFLTCLAPFAGTALLKYIFNL